jgi:alpha-L-arabinofuranosidase
MRRRDFLNLSASASAASIIPLRIDEPVQSATVTINARHEIGRIDKKLYGHQLEHLERIVYGGVFDPSSKFADETGLRTDVIQAVKQMGGAHIVRWPGGNFASYYRWKDGIGPRASRPRRFDVTWKTYESNHFGTDEYLALCRKLNCEPFITANMGTGSIEEACQWVEYCNKAKREPRVNIWGLGNEHFGPWQVGHYTAEEYGRRAAQYAQFMRAVDSSIKFVGVGVMSTEGWNETVLKHCGEELDWLSVHLYGHRYFHDQVDDFDQSVATPVFFEREMQAMADQIKNAETKLRRSGKEPIKICLEEWNTRHNLGVALFRESPRNIVDALFVAGVFNACHRLSSRVTMSNYIYLVNAHAPLFVRPDGVVRHATYDVFRLYSTVMQPRAVLTQVESSTFSADIPGDTMRDSRPGQTNKVVAKRIDASATVSEDGRSLAVALLNRERARTVRVKLDIQRARLSGRGTLHTLTAPTLTAINSLERPSNVHAVSRAYNNSSYVDLPPHSVNILEMSLE